MKGRHQVLAVVITLGILYSNTNRLFAQDMQKNRTIVNLNGRWDVAEGGIHNIPDSFPHTVPVPGLIDMAEPAFDEVGRLSELREAFWYRRTFRIDGEVPATALLKLHKAKYGSKIFLNGRVVAEHLPSFTPAYLNVAPYIHGNLRENELIIRVGANRESLPEGRPSGWDFEKYKYIPGIYDDVELILTGAPFIANVQVVPDILTGIAQFVVEVDKAETGSDVVVQVEVVEAVSGRQVGTATAGTIARPEGKTTIVNAAVHLEDVRLWSPEDPFLYEARLSTGSDEKNIRFGMRSFKFDPVTHRAILNGKPYPLRGTNVTAYRFFEDDEREDRPWRKEWVRRLHRRFKELDWNSIRYCIGFPPDFWYDIADEEGFLIQDEFPIWLLGSAPESPKAEFMIPEYEAWMRERWNHPSVVIWDAQNESLTEETAKTIAAVRHLDLSNRPWENGWMDPQGPSDAAESHPYFFIRGWDNERQSIFSLEELAEHTGIPRLRENQKAMAASVIINEYGWLWLTRDGQPTSLTHHYYDEVLGTDATPAERRYMYARNLAALTEFWRAHREAAGVLHFCGLAYSRPGDIPRPEGGATSDHFTDMEHLTFEPNFLQYVGDAFSPVGIMLDFWRQEVQSGTEQPVRVIAINDLYDRWEGEIVLRIEYEETVVSEFRKRVEIDPLGHETADFSPIMPNAPGRYMFVAELTNHRGENVRSLRDVRIVR